MVFRHTNGIADPGEGVFSDEAILGFAEQEADDGFVVWGFDLSVLSWEVAVEAVDGDALAQMDLALGVNIWRGPRPAMLDDLGRMPCVLGVCGNLGKEGDEMEPGQLGSRLLTNWSSGELTC